MPRKEDPAVRFWRKVNKDGPVPEKCPELGPCWLWTAAHDTCGYGLFYPEHKKSTHAHRYGYFLVFGEFDRSLDVCHRCDVRDCVNPEHLFLGTVAENMGDMIRKNGGKHHSAKLTAQEVIEIRRRVAAGESGRQVAFSFGVNEGTVYAILKGKNHKHVKEGGK